MSPIIVDSRAAATGLTFAELVAEFYARGFDYLNDGAAGEARAKRWVNQAYLALCARADFPFLFADTTGPAPLTINDMRVVLSVYDPTQRTPLPAVNRAALIGAYDDLTLTGTPRFWYRSDQATISTYPVSTDSLQVRYVAKPALLADDGDQALVPAEWCDLIVDGAVLKAKKDDDDYDQYAQAYEQDVQRMITAELDDNSSFGWILDTAGADDWGWR